MIKYRRHKGTIPKILIVGAFITVMFVITFTAKLITIEAQDVQDGLHFANISTYKEIDKRVLGNDKEEVIIKDPENAFNNFKNDLKINMDLDNNFIAKNSSIITGKVTIKHFVIYNVQGTIVKIYSATTNGNISCEIKDLSKEEVKTPNGYKIEATTVHSTISFKVKGVFGNESEEEATVDTDIVNEEIN